MSDNRVYVDDLGTIILIDCGEDISDATSVSMAVRKPDGSEVEWAAEIYGTNSIKHIIEEGEIDITGVYKLQPLIAIGSWTGKGITVEFEVFTKWA